MKLIQALFILLLPISLLAAPLGEVSGDYVYIDNGDGTCQITDYTGSALDINVPASLEGLDVTSFGTYAFYNATVLESITVPSGVTSFGMGCFGNCIALNSITIPDSLDSFGLQAFYNCLALPKIIIPNNVIEIGADCFVNCNSLTNMIFKGNAPTVTLTSGLPVLKIYYYTGKTGFATPEWQGYPCVPIPEPAFCGLMALAFIFFLKRK